MPENIKGKPRSRMVRGTTTPMAHGVNYEGKQMTEENTADIMLDLETLSSEPDAAIVAIGAACFGSEKFDPTVDNFYAIVELSSSARAGGLINASTVEWWMNQSAEARSIFSDGNRYHIGDALWRFQNFCGRAASCVRVWGNGAGFDNVVLRRAYERSGIEPPWAWRDDRCYRTLKNLRPDIPFEPFPKSIPHRADHDAINQAIHAQKILKAIGY